MLIISDSIIKALSLEEAKFDYKKQNIKLKELITNAQTELNKNPGYYCYNFAILDNKGKLVSNEAFGLCKTEEEYKAKINSFLNGDLNKARYFNFKTIYNK